MKIIHATAGSVVWTHGPITRATTPRWAVDEALRALTAEKPPAGILNLLTRDELKDLAHAMNTVHDPYDALAHDPTRKEASQ